MKSLENVRNFSIIAHIDHGKSTLADRFLEITKTISKRDMKDQLLDQMDLEREKGITIKLAPVTMEYTGSDGKEYILNLIDTPGHVDFSYEVSRSLACCEGALLLVDASQGIQAQTLSNLYLAIEHDLEIIPVINKIDHPNANVELVENEIKNIVGVKSDEIYKISAKTGEGVQDLLQAVLKKVPPPEKIEGKTKALIFDSVYDNFQGVIAYVRVFSGSIKRDDIVTFLQTQSEIKPGEVGIFTPKRHKQDVLEMGSVGYVVTGLKKLQDCKVGDTLATSKEAKPLPGYKKMQPMVYASFYPVDADDFPTFKEALEKLSLNDASITYDFENSKALGRGFRCGFLGLLHLEIIQERLKREFDLDMVITVPTVAYTIVLKDGTEKEIMNPAEFPDPSNVIEIKEPWASVDVIVPTEKIGRIMELIQAYRGVYKNTEYLDPTRALLHYELPLSSIISDFYDKLKSASSGYASLSYEVLDEKRPSALVKLDILIAGETVEAFSKFVPKDEAQHEGRELVGRLKDVIPKKNFLIPVQAAVGSTVIARENIRPYRKDVTSKLYGGDITRKRKLLEKQKKGKQKMKQMGDVDIPQEAFLAVLKK
ncbi:translation elongation factor 4 [Patescibacteria group bacterium]|nr:translation elongation factor 4 [Patescibacteria group bacterium]